jgi:hypothetical protein
MAGVNGTYPDGRAVVTNVRGASNVKAITEGEMRSQVLSKEEKEGSIDTMFSSAAPKGNDSPIVKMFTDALGGLANVAIGGLTGGISTMITGAFKGLFGK